MAWVWACACAWVALGLDWGVGVVLPSEIGWKRFLAIERVYGGLYLRLARYSVVNPLWVFSNCGCYLVYSARGVVVL